MIVGIVKEIKPQEYRVALLPKGVSFLVERGHQVVVERGCGAGAGYSDGDYREAGASVAGAAPEVFSAAELIVKVKEPVAEEFPLFRDKQILFSYLHSETRPGLVDMLLGKRVSAIAFENIRDRDGSFPLLAPMSVIAGQQAVLQGLQFLCNHRGGIGINLAAYPGLEPARVVVFGAGPAGLNAARVAAALGAEVVLFEISNQRIAQVSRELPANVRLLHIQGVDSDPYVCAADLVVNAATIAPDSSHHLIPRSLLAKMKRGAVIVDVTANLKGAVESVDHYTTHDDPVWVVDGVVHYAVNNIPGTVARTASQALAAAVLPYLVAIADRGLLAALAEDEGLARGLTTMGGVLAWHQAGVLQKRPWRPPTELIKELRAEA